MKCEHQKGTEEKKRACGRTNRQRGGRDSEASMVPAGRVPRADGCTCSIAAVAAQRVEGVGVAGREKTGRAEQDGCVFDYCCCCSCYWREEWRCLLLIEGDCCCCC